MLRAGDSDTPATAWGKLVRRRPIAACNLPTVGLGKSALRCDFSTVVWTTAVRQAAPQFPTLPSAPAVDIVSSDLTHGGPGLWDLCLGYDQECADANKRDHRLADDTKTCLPDDPDQWIRLAELTSDPFGRSLTVLGRDSYVRMCHRRYVRMCHRRCVRMGTQAAAAA